MTNTKHPTLISMPSRILGSRVTLRPYTVEDAKLVHEAVDESQDHLRPWVNWVDDMAYVDDCRDYCLRCAAQWQLRTDLSVGIFLSATGEYLGGTGLHQPKWDLRAFEVGYWLRRSALGNGYVTEAVALLAQFAIEHLDAQRIEITCDAANSASSRVAHNAGFVLEGTLRNAAVGRDGRAHDWLMFSMIPMDLERSGAEA